jgi:hypothetical protein
MDEFRYESTRRTDIHVHLHIDFKSPIFVQILPKQAYKANLQLSSEGENMPGTITIDTTNETALVSFVDDHGDPTAAPAGVVATFASDNEAVATVAADANNPLQADITPTGLGTANISCAFNGTALEANGSPIADPASVAVTVVAGPAAGAEFVLSE